eukprot:TRINITY_DN9115_c0_g1_i3.p1 TRINITY_DN9115_c0_g1~~TRINITY_DN9115_c0_g1_i3.p1  ORF type:complete len:1157 (+),score=377.92 TRINITY_DN9115_c0_g1_i3:339-3809(+)
MNNYQIYEEIGRGRHSTVYKGRLKKTVEYYAIKSVDKAQRSRVLNEVTMLHQLSHPNILHFFHWYETNNHLWLIEEYCTGSDVLTLLKQDTSLPEETLVTFASDLLSALNFIHSKGIIYCDLKPSNILIDAHGFLKLSDFGLACHVDDVTPEKRKIGTPTYMAPETFQEGGVLSFTTDLWSLGIVLYEIFVGKPPFVDQTLDGLIHKIVYKDYVRPTGCSRGFIEILEGLLEKDPLERLDWVDLPNHEFWKEKNFVPVTAKQPAFEEYKARRASADGAKSSKEVKERTRQQVAKISATAQQNMVREQQSSTYDRKGEVGFEADAEVDFGESPQEEDNEGDDDSPSPGMAPTTAVAAEEESKVPQVSAPPITAKDNQGQIRAPPKPSTGEIANAAANTPAPVSGDFNALLFNPSDNHVKPIMCNTRVERLSEVKFESEELPFPAHTLQEVCSMNNAALEAFLTSIYSAVGGHTTIAEKQNCLCYFETLCGATVTANLFINSLLMALFVKMIQNKSYTPGLKARLCLVMGLLIRHATFINSDLAKTGIVNHLLVLFEDKSVKVRRRAVACLGELLFYIATQQPADRDAWGVGKDVCVLFSKGLDSEDEAVRHYTVKTIENISGHSDADYTNHFAQPAVVKALLLNFNPPQNSDKATKNDYLKSSAISSVSRICRAHHPSLLYVLEEIGTSGLVQGLASGSNTRSLQSCLNITNLVLCKACLVLKKNTLSETNLIKAVDFSTKTTEKPAEGVSGEHIFKTTVLSDADCKRILSELETLSQSLIHGLMSSLEHSSVVIRGKTLLAISLLTVCDLRYLYMCCESKLTPLLEKISKETDKYIVACYETFTGLLSNAVTMIISRLNQNLSSKQPIAPLREVLSIVPHVLTAHSVLPAVFTSNLVGLVAQGLALAEPTSGSEDSPMQQLLLMAEAMSQDMVSMKKHAQEVVKNLLPVLTNLLESRHGDTRFMSLKIFIDVLVPYLQTAGSGNQKEVTTLILNKLFPKLFVLLDDEEPIPLYGLKLLNSIATENPAFVAELAKKEWALKLFAFFELEHRNNNVHNVKLVLKVMTCPSMSLETVFELGVVGKVCCKRQNQPHTAAEPSAVVRLSELGGVVLRAVFGDMPVAAAVDESGEGEQEGVAGCCGAAAEEHRAVLYIGGHR